MAARYHISPDGKARQCRAKTPDACRATIASMRGQHFDSKPEAAQAYEKVMEEKTLKRHQKQKTEKRKNNRRSRLTDIKKTQRSSFSEEEIAEMHRKEKAEIALKKAEMEKLEAEILAIEEKEIRAVEKMEASAESIGKIKKSLDEEYTGNLKDVDRLSELRDEKNEITKKFKQELTINSEDANILEYDPYTFSAYRNRTEYKPLYKPIDEIANKIYFINSTHLSKMLIAEKDEKFGLMDKVFTNKEKEREKLLMNSAIDYIKNIYDPNDSELVRDSLMEQARYARHAYDSPSARFAREFIKEENVFGERVIVLKASDKNFPVEGQKDYVHFADLDLSNNEDDKRELTSIHEKLSNIEAKMEKYDQMLKESGKEADPEIVQSARMTYDIGQRKASDIINRVREENKVRREVESFYARSAIEEKEDARTNEELNEVSLDLYHELKLTGF